MQNKVAFPPKEGLERVAEEEEETWCACVRRRRQERQWECSSRGQKRSRVPGENDFAGDYDLDAQAGTNVDRDGHQPEYVLFFLLEALILT